MGNFLGKGEETPAGLQPWWEAWGEHTTAVGQGAEGKHSFLPCGSAGSLGTQTLWPIEIVDPFSPYIPSHRDS